MSPTDDLHCLVLELSAPEKRYVRLFASKQNNNNYLKLFDALLEMEEYDEHKLLALFNGKKKQQMLASEKNYLFRFLLKALRNFHEERTVDSCLKEMLINSSLLIEKRLYNSGIKELERAKKLALKHERYLAIVEILQLQMSILIERKPKKTVEELALIKTELNEVLGHLNKQLRLTMLQKDVFVNLRSRYQLREDEFRQHYDQWTDQLNNFLPLNNELLFTNHIYLNTKAQLALFDGKFNEASKIYENLLQLWESNPDRIKEEVLDYMKLLANYLSACHGNNAFEKMPKLLAKLNKVPCRSAEEHAERFQNSYFIDLLYRINTDRFEDFPEFAMEIEKGLQQFSTKINEARCLAFLYNVGNGYFLLGDWKESLKWLQNLINREKTSHRVDFQNLARIMRLLLYYELGKHDTLDYELTNVERYLRQRKSWFSYEASLVRFLKKLIGADVSEQEVMFKKFQVQLEHLVKGKDSASLPGSSELALWIQFHLTGKSMRELLKGD